jgi:glycosyltransferase involved in cell wall biosynthesis
MVNVAVIILTHDEELNIEYALRAVCGWARQVFVFDSFSTDRTVEIARGFERCEVVQHVFENYGAQRNAALRLLPIEAEWILFLDADEYPTEELKREIEALVARNPPEDGFWIKWRLIWMGTWIRRGYYPTWILRLVRKTNARCEDRDVNEHMVVTGSTGRLEHDLIHEDHKSLDRWVLKHLRYADAEARASLIRAASHGEIEGSLLGSQAERKRWVRRNVWERLPRLVRPALYFGYRAVVRGGVLDGRRALAYHVMQALWFQTLVDLKCMEIEREATREGRVS